MCAALITELAGNCWPLSPRTTGNYPASCTCHPAARIFFPVFISHVNLGLLQHAGLCLPACTFPRITFGYLSGNVVVNEQLLQTERCTFLQLCTDAALAEMRPGYPAPFLGVTRKTTSLEQGIRRSLKTAAFCLLPALC